MNKKFLIIIFFVFFFFYALWFSNTKSQEKTDKVIFTPARVAPAISAPRTIVFPGDNNVKFSFSSPPPQFPEELETYAVTYPPNIESTVENLAARWGFTTGVKKPVTYVLDWIEREKHLSLNTKTNTLSFAYFYPSINSSMIGRLTKESVINDLTKTGIIQKSMILTEVKNDINTTLGEGLDEGAPPSTFTSYHYTISGVPYPFIFTGVNQYAATFRTVGAGYIVSFSLRIPPFIKPQNTKKTLSMDEVLLSLNENRGLLVGVSENSVADPYSMVGEFSSVEISSISIGYFFDVSTSVFNPIFIISGTAFGDKVYRVKYYIRATL